VIELTDVTVQFGAVRPLDRLNAVFTKLVCGLIGPNGAGKTTLINVLSSFLTPISGQIKVDGRDMFPLDPVQ
jgi:branched-chain amino acid transport system ATP-binding protein